MTPQDLQDLYELARSAPIIASRHEEVGRLFAVVEHELNLARIEASKAYLEAHIAKNKTAAE